MLLVLFLSHSPFSPEYYFSLVKYTELIIISSCLILWPHLQLLIPLACCSSAALSHFCSFKHSVLPGLLCHCLEHPSFLLCLAYFITFLDLLVPLTTLVLYTYFYYCIIEQHIKAIIGLLYCFSCKAVCS